VHDEEESLYVERPQSELEVMRGNRVVVGIDGSAGSKAALRFALEDAARRSVPVEAVLAYRPPDYQADFSELGVVDEDRLLGALRTQHDEMAHSVVRDVTRLLPGPVPEVHVRAVMGPPSGVLVRESEGADLLVLGSRGHGGFHNMLLGSTSIQCTMHATCPVTVVHSPEAHRHRLRLHREARSEGESVAGEPSEAGVPS
jgi:nucleotide-binding universal stress UspA family protein